MREDKKLILKKISITTVLCLMLCGCMMLTACTSKEEPANIPMENEIEQTAQESPVSEVQDENKKLQSETLANAIDAEKEEKTSESPAGEAQAEITNEQPESEEQPQAPSNPYDFTICFAGDINLDEAWSTTQFLNQQENGIRDCISEELIAYMQQADVMCLNNEFTYSLQGAPLEGKMYTFRANPERVSILQEMGVDLVKLANNHVYDYGKQALLDTFETLENAGIPYIGAGRNLEEAMKPVYIELDGKTVAFVAASRAEKYKMTPQATAEEPGILRCYDTTLFLETIAEARKNADFVLAYVHWGTEYSYELQEVQLTTGKEYLDAGADAIIGAHSHCLQGMEYYDGKPIIYSLGNYWFNDKTLDTMLVNLHFYGDDENKSVEVQVVPALQSGLRTQIAKDEAEQERIYTFLEDISVNVEIDSEGIVHEKN